VSRLLTLAETAERLGCSLPTVRRRVRSGELPVFRDGRLVRVAERDLERYVAERTLAPAAPPPVPRARRGGFSLRPGERLWNLADPPLEA